MSRKFFLFVTLLLLATGLCLAIGPDGSQPNAMRDEMHQLRNMFPGMEKVVTDKVTGQPLWLHGDLGRIDPAATVSKSAVQFFDRVAPVFRLQAVDSLRVTRMETDDMGMKHIRLSQTHRGLPVDGGEIMLHVDKNGVVRTINGHLGGEIEIAPKPAIRDDEAVDYMLQRLDVDKATILEEPVLVYFAQPNEPTFLAWRGILEYTDRDGFHQERIYVNAEDGTLLDRQGLLYDALYRKIYNANQSTTVPGSLMFQEGGSSSDSIAMAAYNNTGLVYNFYMSVFNRDSYNNNGAQINSSVHCVFSTGYSTTPNNAAWSDYYGQFLFGDGDGSTFSPLTNAVDVIAHEFTHAVTSSTANLNYSNESGALNEAMSDILGAACEAWEDGSANSNTWKIGEDVYTPRTAGDALRYMNDPTADGQSYDYYPERYTGSSDNGGVHLNSGIANLAFYLVCQGGTHPRNKTSVSVPAIGITKARNIFYRALASYMTSTTNFEGARNATAQAAQDLYGSTEAAAIQKAWDAVGVPGSSTPSTVTELNNGQTLSNLSGSTGSWQYFKIAVPASQTSLEIKIFNGSGDCDLYVKRGSQPSSSSYDYRPYLNGNTETVTVSNPASGDWYIGLNAYSTYSGLSLQATYAGSSGGGGGGEPGVTVLTNGVPVTNVSGAKSAEAFYKIAVPAGQSSLEIKTSGGSGDCDLYVKLGSQPTTSSYDYRPYLNGNNETVTVTNPSSGDWYVMLRGYSAYSGLTLQATYAGSGGGGGGTGSMSESESNNTTSSADVISSSPTEVTGTIGSSSDVDYYRVTLPAGATLTIDMAVPSGKDYDMRFYNSSGSTLASGLNGTGQAEHVTYTNSSSSAMYVYVKVYPYSGYGSTPYTLQVDW